MEPADSIGRLGFKKWYERQLIESHAYLVTGLLCTILLATTFEYIDFRNAPARAGMLVAIAFVAGAIAAVTVRRFMVLLARAERYGDKSICPQCGAYARFDILSVDNRPADGPSLALRCRKCPTEWSMP